MSAARHLVVAERAADALDEASTQEEAAIYLTAGLDACEAAIACATCEQAAAVHDIASATIDRLMAHVRSDVLREALASVA